MDTAANYGHLRGRHGPALAAARRKMPARHDAINRWGGVTHWSRYLARLRAKRALCGTKRWMLRALCVNKPEGVIFWSMTRRPCGSAAQVLKNSSRPFCFRSLSKVSLEARFLRRFRPAFFGPFRGLPPQPAALHAPWPGDLAARLSEGSESTFRCPRPDIGGLAPRQKPA